MAKSDGEIVDDWIVFRAKDKAILKTLTCYHDECINLKCDSEHIKGIRELILRVENWQKDHPERVRVADTLDSDIITNIVGW